MWRRRRGGITGLLVSDFHAFSVEQLGVVVANMCDTAQGFPKARERLEELKMGAKGKKRDIRRSNRKEGDCVVM